MKTEIDKQPEEEKLPYPTKDWFRKNELGKKTVVLEYMGADGENIKVAFDIHAVNENRSRLLMAECQEIDEIGKATPISLSKYHDMMIQESVRYGDPPQMLSQEDLEGLKENKGTGIFDALLIHVMDASGLASPSNLVAEKK